MRPCQLAKIAGLLPGSLQMDLVVADFGVARQTPMVGAGSVVAR